MPGKRLRRRLVKKFYQLFYVLILTISTGSIVVALASAKPTVKVGVSTQIRPVAINIPDTEPSPEQTGTASWYALGLPRPEEHTCASTKFPRGTYLLVKNLRNQKSVVCLVNDYGPEAFTKRVIDLSLGSFREIEEPSRGTAPVEIRQVPEPPSGINLPFPQSFAGIFGYSKCYQQYSPEFCDTHRFNQ